jgi:hypothetical protein
MIQEGLSFLNFFSILQVSSSSGSEVPIITGLTIDVSAVVDTLGIDSSDDEWKIVCCCIVVV